MGRYGRLSICESATRARSKLSYSNPHEQIISAWDSRDYEPIEEPGRAAGSDFKLGHSEGMQ
jgi:hypothetical protein